MIRVHGTCIDIRGSGVLLRGPSGSGKSDLALRLIDGGAVLVADDQTEIRCEDGLLYAAPPAVIAGMIEVRGLGLVRLPYRELCPLRLIVDLVAPEALDRLPITRSETVLDVALPVVSLAPFEASAAAKLRLALGVATGDIMLAT